MIRGVFLFATLLASFGAAFVSPPPPVVVPRSRSTDAVFPFVSSLQAADGGQANNNHKKSSWEERWNDMYARIQTYQQQHGDTTQGQQVPVSSFPVDDVKLTNWVAIQRENLRRGVMREDRRTKLASIGITCSSSANHQSSGSRTSTSSTDDATIISSTNKKAQEGGGGKASSSSSSWEQRWEDMYQKLRAFHETSGHTQVTSKYDDPKLANWVSIQRENLRRGVMRQDRVERLADIGIF